MVDTTIAAMPDKMATIPKEINRVAFYSLKVDRANVSVPLAKQIQGKIEAKISSTGRITVIYAPEIKPIKITAGEGSLTLSSGFQTTEEIRAVSDKLRLDGMMEGEFYLTKDTLYLNLRIFDTRSMAVVWSQEFSSILPPVPLPPPPPPPPPPVPVKKYTGVDYGFGIAGLQLMGTDTTGVKAPSYAQYYCIDFRISEKTILTEKVRWTLTGGFLSLMTGLKSGRDSLGQDVNVNNTSVSGRILATPFARVGVRMSLIPAKILDEHVANPFTKPKDVLASELSIGKLWVRSTTGLNTVGLRFECDITRVLSVAAGFYYASQDEVAIAANGRKVKVGGTYYEVSLLRFNFMP
jgi:hypothetical protein